MKQPKEKKVQEYLPDGWPEMIRYEAIAAGHRKGISISTIKRVVHKKQIKHKLWPLVWAHVLKGKEKETQLNEVLTNAA